MKTSSFVKRTPVRLTQCRLSLYEERNTSCVQFSKNCLGLQRRTVIHLPASIYREGKAACLIILCCYSSPLYDLMKCFIYPFNSHGHIYNCQSQNHRLPLHIDRFFQCPPPPQPTPNQPIKHFLINTHQGWTAFISTKSNGSRLETIKSMSLQYGSAEMVCGWTLLPERALSYTKIVMGHFVR